MPVRVIFAVTVIVALAPLASDAMVQGNDEHPPPLTLVMERCDGESVICTLVAVEGPALETTIVYWTISWLWKGPAVSSVLVTETSADVPAEPLLPVLSVLFAVFGSNSAPVAVWLLSNVPIALMVAVTVIVVLAPEARLAMVQGSVAQPDPLTLVMVRLVGVSVT